MKLKKWYAPIFCFCIFAIVLIVLIIKLCYLGLSKTVDGINIQEFAKNRNTVTSVLTSKRGTIFDFEGNVLAQNITSYTLIAHLDPTRTVDDNNPKHVVDKEYTAVKLSQILGEDNYEYILKRLNSESKQVEFGNVGRNLTELTKIAIEELDLPGISFVESVKRYYPNGNFASYVIGYAKQYDRINVKINDTYDLSIYYKYFFDNYSNIKIEYNDDELIKIDGTVITGLKEGNCPLYIKTNGDILASIIVNVINYDVYESLDNTIVGELGIEKKYDKKLQGIDGYTKYQQDKYGYKIPDTPEETVESINGYDIYLTIDSNLQRFAENAVSELNVNYKPKWSIISVMDAKSGEILASATSPSFNPNSLSSNMSYQNPLVSYTYEPGSVMKIYTYMCAIETGLYNGEKTYLSGSYEFADGTIMSDWNKRGWGYLTYDAGFAYSSNVGVINMIKDYLSSKQLRECLIKYGFGKETEIELSNELKGNLDFEYETEVMAAGFGQGISTTPIQQLQALTIIANDGVMVKPHIIKKMVDTNTGKEFKTQVVKSEQLVKTSTINKIKDLMESVIQRSAPTGSKYYLEGYNLIGKTGTAQIYENGKYLTGVNDYIVSIAIMYPKEDPKVIIYAAAKQPSNSNYALPSVIPDLIKNISKYLQIFDDNLENSVDTSYSVKSYINKDVDNVVKQLKENYILPVVIGDGDKVVNQYPKKNTTIMQGDKVFIITNYKNIDMIDLSGWSRYDANKFCELTGLVCEFDGYGYVVSQSIKKYSNIVEGEILKILLGNVKVHN